jgi:hypothetical protein
MITLDYPSLLDQFRVHIDPKRRSESAAFLIWYLEQYYRLDSLEAVDSVCDQKGDWGVDGIFVNDNAQTITIFQARISQRADRTVGDSSLREFAGTLTQFADAASIEKLMKAAANVELGSLIKKLDLINKIGTHEIRGEYLTNIEIDTNGHTFLKSAPNITFVGKTALMTSYVSDSRELPIQTPAAFDIYGLQATEYIVDTNTKAVIAPIKAVELVALDGIADQSIFEYNVRGPLGRTQVNKDISKSIVDSATHKLFPLFHNGITIVAKSVDISNDQIIAREYYVVNGCQSMNALHTNAGKLSDDLRVLVKFIQTAPGSDLARMVTQFSNNQNGVRPRDFKSNNPIQIRLQNEIEASYRGIYHFEIKRGEMESGATSVISNEEAGLWLRAFDLKEPWVTHRKFEVFEDKYADLFGRPEVTADRIVMLKVIMEAIDAGIPHIENQSLGKYALTRHLLLYIIREILESDSLFKEITTEPERFVRGSADRSKFVTCIQALLKDALIDLNAEVKALGENFYYRDKLRDSTWVREICRKIVGDHQKLVARGRIPSFKEEWERP